MSVHDEKTDCSTWSVMSIGLYYVKAPHCASTSCLFRTLPCEKQSFEKLDR